MKGTSLKKSRGAANAPRSESNCNGILVSGTYSVNRALVQWRREAARLWTEYRRTGHPSHLRAFRIHRAAMGGRLHGETATR